MKTWCVAICDRCGYGRYIFVSNPSCTASYLSGEDREIQQFVEQHTGCNLRGIRFLENDIQKDLLWAEGYEMVGNEFLRVGERNETEISRLEDLYQKELDRYRPKVTLVSSPK